MMKMISNQERHEDILFNPNLNVSQNRKYKTRTHFIEKLFVDGELRHQLEVTENGSVYTAFS
ncbi:hypothetical protein AT251_16785 [Enterovibrio nigricans]|uniref:Uncharacterized protein n=1 Tax=Enterovibrio nigricans DSM 22720 TaxID=1121868 RepID=A0A1T4VJ55_9GAMM|nr:hypothetical protein AT251_16785 [Enterovibrio nigricans]SKA64982.1 hypothetical protein SAMN02745132_03909 [Enterovibrio nigricans DSM 22720]